ncbi:MAG: hypothetical protein V3W34_19810 [Phycisphaerae bacterium]
MKKMSVLTFIGIGRIIERLRWVNAGPTFSLISRHITLLLRILDETGFTVTRRHANALESFRDAHLDSPKDAIIDDKAAKKLRKFAQDIDVVLTAEVPGHVAYFVTEMRLRVELLLNQVDGLFRPGVFDQLPEIARNDLADAARCIAFEVPTPAASMLLRGTEGVLRHFYESCVRQPSKRISPLLWGSIVNHLKTVRHKPPSTSLLAELDQLRNYYRNPTQHPDRRYTLDEVQDLWGLCVNVINQMVGHSRWR